MDYGFNLKYDTPDFISWAQAERERNDKRAQERMQNYINLMQMLGRGVGAYKMGKDYRDWKADQAYWNDESDMLDLIGAGYYDPNDIDIDAALELERTGRKPAEWTNPYDSINGYTSDDLPTLRDLGLA